MGSGGPNSTVRPGIARPSPKEGVVVGGRKHSNSLVDPPHGPHAPAHSRSATATFLSPRQGSSLNVFPVFGTAVSIGSAEDICKEINVTDVSSGIYVAPPPVDNNSPLGIQMSRSVSAERLDVDSEPKTSMFDIDIVSMKKRGVPLERCVTVNNEELLK